MSRQRKSRLWTAGLVFASAILTMLAGALPAWAALGGDIVTILADQAQMQGTRNVTPASSYTVHEIQGDNGMVVREYQSAEGHVFAVAWHGPWMPDMQQILGSYFDQYAQAMKARRSARRGRGPVSIEEPGLNVQMGGHPRWFAGKAYIPEKLPQGMRAEDIQ